jgi:hypothetical protein
MSADSAAMELVQSIIEKAVPFLVAAFWIVVVQVVIAAIKRSPLARTFIEYVANTADEPDDLKRPKSQPKTHSATRYA